MRVIVASIACAVADPESHTDLALVDVLAVALDVTMVVRVVRLDVCKVKGALDGHWSLTLGTVESEIPAFAAVSTSVDAQVSLIIYVQSRVTVQLGEDTVL